MNRIDRLNSQLAKELDELIRGLPVGAHFDVLPSSDICYSLELFLPRLLLKHYPEWEDESLDGIFVARAIKTGPATAELVGTCILITDQTVTPFITELEVVRTCNPSLVAAIRLMLGVPGTGALGISGPPCNSRDAQRLFTSLIDKVEDMEWVYSLEPQREKKGTEKGDGDGASH